MSIITFPLNGIAYDANDVGKFFATRKSGVYSAEDSFNIESFTSNTITIGTGQAWIQDEPMSGKSITMTEPQTLTITGSTGSTYRIVLRFDLSDNETTLAVKDSRASGGINLVRSNGVYELGLYDILYTGEITSADITDLRLDEDLCGLMRDGVTSIPTRTLMNNFTDTVTKIIADYEELDQGVAAGLEAQIQRYKIQTGSYQGDGGLSKELTFVGEPVFLAITEQEVRSDHREFLYGRTPIFFIKGLKKYVDTYYASDRVYIEFSVSGNKLTWTYTLPPPGYDKAFYPFNTQGKTYFYVAFCERSGE